MTDHLTALLLLADSRLPAGSHAHSGGLEPAVAAGRVRGMPELERFLRGRLATAGRVAAAFTAAACAGAGDSHRLIALDAGLDARTASPAARRASYAQGRALARAARALYPTPRVAEPGEIQLGPSRVGPEQLHDRRHQPVVLGVTAALAGLAPEPAAGIAGYGSVAGPASAAVRLLGLDPYRVHALLAALAPECDQIATEAGKTANSPVEALPAAGAPMLDIHAETHASWEVRLFAS